MEYKNIFPGIILITVLWFAFSTYHYVCKVKELCEGGSYRVVSAGIADRDDSGERAPQRVQRNNGGERVVTSTETQVREQVTIECPSHIRTQISPTASNNVRADVERLEQFLNEYYDAGLEIDGQYGRDDQQAVIAFQRQFADQVLIPSGLSDANANVGFYTATQINSQKCAFDFAAENN